jgi:hypothetical protein
VWLRNPQEACPEGMWMAIKAEGLIAGSIQLVEHYDVEYIGNNTVSVDIELPGPPAT